MAGLAVAAGLESFEDARFFKDAIDFAASSRHQQRKMPFPHEQNQVFQSHDAGGVQVTGVFQTQDDHLQLGIGDGALDLRPK